MYKWIEFYLVEKKLINELKQVFYEHYRVEQDISSFVHLNDELKIIVQACLLA